MPSCRLQGLKISRVPKTPRRPSKRALLKTRPIEALDTSIGGTFAYNHTDSINLVKEEGTKLNIPVGGYKEKFADLDFADEGRLITLSTKNVLRAFSTEDGSLIHEYKLKLHNFKSKNFTFHRASGNLAVAGCKGNAKKPLEANLGRITWLTVEQGDVVFKPRGTYTSNMTEPFVPEMAFAVPTGTNKPILFAAKHASRYRIVSSYELRGVNVVEIFCEKTIVDDDTKRTYKEPTHLVDLYKTGGHEKLSGVCSNGGAVGFVGADGMIGRISFETD